MSYYQNDRNETTRFDAQRVRRAQEQQQKRPPQQRPPQRRPRRKRIGPAAILLYFGFILVFSALLAGTAWLLANDICSFNKKEAEVAIVVEEEDSIKSVAKKLKSEGLINYKGVFCLFAGVFDAEIEDLVEVKGMTRNAAILIKTIMPLARRYKDCKFLKGYSFENIDEMGEYLIQKHFGNKNETLKD